MNQAHKSNFKTHVEKLNPTSRTDLSNKTLRSTLYWKLTFKPFPYKSFGWCNAHSVQADALWGRSFKFQMKNTPQNQYFPANAERMDVHCLESGCIGKYIPLGPRDFPRAWILHPSALEISLGLRPREISRASGCKIPALGKSLGPRGMYFPIHPSSRQCTYTMFMLLSPVESNQLLWRDSIRLDVFIMDMSVPISPLDNLKLIWHLPSNWKQLGT